MDLEEGGDVIVKYNYCADKFEEFYSGDEIDEVILYDGTEGLQPTIPANLTVSWSNNLSCTPKTGQVIKVKKT